MYKNKVFIIIGGLGQIGSSFVLHILNNNGKVLVGDIKKTNREVFESLNRFSDFYFKECDVNNDSALTDLLKFASEKFKTIDGAIYCAYPRSKKWGTPFDKLKRKYLNQDLNSNLSSPLIFSQKIIKLFLNQKKGVLVLLSSIQGVSNPKFDHYIGTKMISPIEYSAIKSGIISITKYLAKMYRKKNIRVNCISPGGIDSNQPKSFKVKYKKDCGAKGLLNAKDLNSALNFILSDESKYLNGQNIVVDDSWSL